ncbi:MAG: SGNH/GDSL hydrolase family protein [Phycisphaerae bacterium]|nr:SGNH/GDSL hydrolase family protein [Phycisphaerae bacterium]
MRTGKDADNSIAEPSPATDRRPRRTRRLMVLVLVGAALVASAVGVRHLWFRWPVGEGPVAIAVPRDAFDHVWTMRDVLLLGIGDSVTDGYGARKGYSYFDRLVANPADEFADMQDICLSTVLPGLRARNDAVSGSTSIQHLRLLEKKLQPQPPETLALVVMTTGGNDIIHDYGRSPPREGAMYGATLAEARPWIDAFAARLETMIARIEAAFPGGCHIFLANIYDPTDGVGDATRAGLPRWGDAVAIIGAYNDVIARCAARHPSVHLVDIHGPFLGHGLHCTQIWREHYDRNDPHHWYYANIEDPNERGYDAIRRLFIREIAKVLVPRVEPASMPAPPVNPR